MKQLNLIPREFDYAIVIGRFEPLHLGHMHLVKAALAVATNVIVLVGSSHQARNIKNPFTFREREEMFSINFPAAHLSGQIKVWPISDHLYNENDWKKEVQEAVEDAISSDFIGGEECPESHLESRKIALVGHTKDNSSYYLKEFPQWEYREIEEHGTLDATTIRELYLDDSMGSMSQRFKMIESLVPAPTLFFLEEFMKNHTDEYMRLHQEFVHIKDYKKKFSGVPYEVIFNTVDNVVVCHGHVLLIQRKDAPGQGLWALPGGFLNPDEFIKTAALRELIEETKIDVPPGKLYNCMTKRHVFDAPGRSLRGRTITHGFLMELDSEKSLPNIKASDDAADAKWISFAELERMSDQLFEDHYHIIMHFLGRAVG